METQLQSDSAISGQAQLTLGLAHMAGTRVGLPQAQLRWKTTPGPRHHGRWMDTWKHQAKHGLEAAQQ